MRKNKVPLYYRGKNGEVQTWEEFERSKSIPELKTRKVKNIPVNIEKSIVDRKFEDLQMEKTNKVKSLIDKASNKMKESKKSRAQKKTTKKFISNIG